MGGENAHRSALVFITGFYLQVSDEVIHTTNFDQSIFHYILLGLRSEVLLNIHLEAQSPTRKLEKLTCTTRTGPHTLPKYLSRKDGHLIQLYIANCSYKKGERPKPIAESQQK